MDGRPTEPVTWIPPMPRGPGAIDAWRSLDRGTRRRLLSGEPATDPTTAVIAVGYARTALAHSALRRRLILFAAVAPVFIAAGTVAYLFRNPAGLVAWFVTLLVTVFGLRLLGRGRAVGLLRMESVNAGRLWTTESPAPPPVAPQVAPGEAFVVRYAPAALCKVYGRVLVLPLAALALIWLLSAPPVFLVAYTTFITVVVVWVGYATLRWTRPWLPALEFGPAGLHIPAQGWYTSWSQVTEIRLTRVPGRSGRQVVAFIVADPEAVLAGWRGPQARRGRTSLSVYGTPLAAPDLLLACSAEEIAAAAGAFTGVPVRRFGG